MTERQPVQWIKVLVFVVAAPIIGGAISIAGAIAVNALFGDETTGSVAFYFAMAAFLPVTAVVTLILPLVFVRERKGLQTLLTFVAEAVLVGTVAVWLVYF
jgi:hypothetical protein